MQSVHSTCTRGRSMASSRVPAADVPEGTVTGSAGYAVGNNGDYFAVSRRCRHLRADLAGGSIDSDGCLVCPWHQAKYDVKTGRMVRGPQGIFAKIPGLEPVVRRVDQGLAAAPWQGDRGRGRAADRLTRACGEAERGACRWIGYGSASSVPPRSRRRRWCAPRARSTRSTSSPIAARDPERARSTPSKHGIATVHQSYEAAASPTPRSTPSTTRCPTGCTPSGPCARSRPASTCCARSRSPPTRPRPGRSPMPPPRRASSSRKPSTTATTRWRSGCAASPTAASSAPSARSARRCASRCPSSATSATTTTSPAAP